MSKLGKLPALPSDGATDHELDLQWGAFLLLHSNDITEHEDFFLRVVFGPDRGGRRRRRPLPQKAPSPEEVQS